MSDELTTIATFTSSLEANMARNRLVSAGISAFLADEAAVTTTWHLSNAIGGVKLLVKGRDVEEACAVLEEQPDAELLEQGLQESEELRAATMPTEVDPYGDEINDADRDASDDTDAPEPVLSNRELDADRAFRGAILGVLLYPVQLYVFWVLLKVFVSDERILPRYRWRAVIASLINLAALLVLYIIWVGFGHPWLRPYY